MSGRALDTLSSTSHRHHPHRDYWDHIIVLLDATAAKKAAADETKGIIMVIVDRVAVVGTTLAQGGFRSKVRET